MARIIPNEHRKPKREFSFWFFCLLIILLLAVVAFFIVSMVQSRVNYLNYLDDFAVSSSYAQGHGGAFVMTADGRERIYAQQVFDIYSLIVKGGEGKQTTPPQTTPDIAIQFGDQSSLRIWEMRVDTAAQREVNGVLISYTNQQGKIYSFDNDWDIYEKILDILKTEKKGD